MGARRKLNPAKERRDAGWSFFSKNSRPKKKPIDGRAVENFARAVGAGRRGRFSSGAPGTDSFSPHGDEYKGYPVKEQDGSWGNGAAYLGGLGSTGNGVVPGTIKDSDSATGGGSMRAESVRGTLGHWAVDGFYGGTPAGGGRLGAFSRGREGSKKLGTPPHWARGAARWGRGRPDRGAGPKLKLR